jgi:hypothetical protein
MKEFVDVLLLITAQFSEAVLDSRQSVHGGHYTPPLTQQQNSDSSQHCNLFQQLVLQETYNIYAYSLFISL